jgi:3-phenylpropionate/trans-cinnamate dioxygenase ferredoxin subunit
LTNIPLESEGEYIFYPLTEAADLQSGERAFFEVKDYQIIIFNIAGEYFAVSDVCSHDEGPLGDGYLQDNVITCPRHGAQFDIKTGKVLSLPAIIDIPTYPLRIENGTIYIGIPVS